MVEVHAAKTAPFCPSPVSLLEVLSYVSEYQLYDRNEEIRRPCVGRTVTLLITRFTVRHQERAVIPSSGYSEVRPDYSGILFYS